MSGIKDKLIDLTEKVIAELKLDNSMDIFDSVQNLIIEMWDCNAPTVQEVVKEYNKMIKNS